MSKIVNLIDQILTCISSAYILPEPKIDSDEEADDKSAEGGREGDVSSSGHGGVYWVVGGLEHRTK